MSWLLSQKVASHRFIVQYEDDTVRFIRGGLRSVSAFITALRCTALVIVILSVRPSVCPSVCLSVTLVHCVHMVQPTIMISSPQGSPIILVSGHITFIPKFEGGHPERVR